MRTYSIPFLLAVVCLVACARTPETADDIAVLRAVLDKACGDESVPLTVISDAMANRDNYSLPRAWSAAGRYWRNPRLHPSSTAPWQPGPLCANVRVVPQGAIDATFIADARIPPSWKKFSATFPGARGYSAYSRPIYSSDGTHALVFVDHHCEGHCGLGEVIELEWADRRWRTIRTAMTWIS